MGPGDGFLASGLVMPRTKKTKLARVRALDVPDAFHIEVSRTLSPYCVALARMTGGDGETFQVFGSGTLVVRDGKYGILTAHHCLHSRKLSRKVTVGQLGTDRLFFISKNGRTMSAAQFELTEEPLAPPKNEADEEAGPDLTFIRLHPGPALSWLKAVGSFWNLDRNVAALRNKFCVERIYIGNLGYPAHRHSVISRTKAEVRIDVTLMNGAGALRNEDVEQRGSWDFIKCPIDYRAYPKLPKHYDGMSGGGIWAVLMERKGDQFEIRDFALLGVTYYQSAIRRGRCYLRGHYVRSIYQRAWRKKRAAAVSRRATLGGE